MKMITASLILLLLLSAGYAAPQMQNGTYAVVTVQMGAHSYDAIRWNRTTGEAYLLRSQAWQPIPEADIAELLLRNPDADLDAIRQTCNRYRLNGLDAILAELQSE